jgi:hypothetical protein
VIFANKKFQVKDLTQFIIVTNTEWLKLTGMRWRMISLEEAIDGMLSAQNNLRTNQAKEMPAYLSEQFYRLGQFTAAVEYHLALEEQRYEADEAIILKIAIRERKMSATAAEKEVKIDLGVREGQIKYLTRITKAAWSQHMGAMARFNHLIQESKGAI